MGNIKFEVSMVFSNAHALKDVVREYAMKERYGLRFVKNELTRVTIVCQESYK